MPILAHMHAHRRAILNDIVNAERSKQFDLAAHLLVKFQKVNNDIRTIEETGDHPQDIKHDLAMQIQAD